MAIVSLTAEHDILQRAREYILLRHDDLADSSQANTPKAGSARKPRMEPTYPFRPYPAKKVRSSLRQEVLTRNALEKEKSASPPASPGLLSSDEFEAAFAGHNAHSGRDDSNNSSDDNDNGGGYDTRTCVNSTSSPTAENHSAPSSINTANATTHDDTPSPASETSALKTPPRKGPGAHWQAKRVTKRKLQDNAAKAREARKRKLNIAAPTAT